MTKPDSWARDALRRRREAALRLPPLWCATCKISYHDPDLHTCQPDPEVSYWHQGCTTGTG